MDAQRDNNTQNSATAGDPPPGPGCRRCTRHLPAANPDSTRAEGNVKIQPQYFGTTPAVDIRESLDWKERLLPNTYSSLGMLACKKAIE